MATDLNLSSSDYSLVLSIFFIGYLLNEVPCNMILSRSRPSIFLPTVMFIWGSMSIGVKGVSSLGGMVAFRFCLGLVEAGFFPGVMLIMSCWYKVGLQFGIRVGLINQPAELSKRIALFYTASLLAGAFGGLLAGAIITGLDGVGNTRGWQWLFIIEGLATALVAIGAYFVLPGEYCLSAARMKSDDQTTPPPPSGSLRKRSSSLSRVFTRRLLSRRKSRCPTSGPSSSLSRTCEPGCVTMKFDPVLWLINRASCSCTTSLRPLARSATSSRL